MKTEKRYDAWLQWTVTDICNLDCEYCWYNLPEDFIMLARRLRRQYLKKKGGLYVLDIPALKEGIKRKIFRKVPRSRKLVKPSIRAIDVETLLRTLERTGLAFRIGLTGGEPMLIPNIVEACEAITEKHYVSFNTNLTSGKVEDFASRVRPERVVEMLGSLHIKQLEKHGLVDVYVKNYLTLKEKGFSVTAQEIAYPPMSAEVPGLRKFFGKKGVDLTFGPFVGRYRWKQYPEAYTADELRVFGLDVEKNVKSFRQEGKPCNAGYNLGVVMASGEVKPCYKIDIVLGNIYTGIDFRKDIVKRLITKRGKVFLRFITGILSS